MLIPANRLTGLGQADMLCSGSTPRPSRQHAAPPQQPCLLSGDYNEPAFTFSLIPKSRHLKQEKDRKPITGWNQGGKEPLKSAVNSTGHTPALPSPRARIRPPRCRLCLSAGGCCQSVRCPLIFCFLDSRTPYGIQI